MSNKLMTIDVVVKFFHPVTAGIETNILNTYSVLVNKGWKVRIHTSKDTHTEKNVLTTHEVIRGMEVIRYAHSAFGYNPKIDWDQTSLVCLHNFNIFPHFTLMIYCLWLKVINKKNFGLVLTPHGGFTPDWNIFSNTEQIIKKIYHYTIGTLLINLIVDKVRAVSEWERKEIVKKNVLKNKVVVISNGVEDEAYIDSDKYASKGIKNDVSSYGKYILQIGRIYPIKNYETTIKALVDVPENVKFVIAGPVADEKYYIDLQKLINKLGLEGRVIFAGVLRGIDKFYLIKKATMMVHMAHWESFCNVIHEGMSQGLVCIVADNTALPLLIKNDINGYTLSENDNNALSIKINYILNNFDTKEINDMKARNKKFGLEESWVSVAEKMDVLYKSIKNKYEK